MFLSQGIQVFVFLTILWFTKSVRGVESPTWNDITYVPAKLSDPPKIKFPVHSHLKYILQKVFKITGVKLTICRLSLIGIYWYQSINTNQWTDEYFSFSFFVFFHVEFLVVFGSVIVNYNNHKIIIPLHVTPEEWPEKNTLQKLPFVKRTKWIVSNWQFSFTCSKFLKFKQSKLLKNPWLKVYVTTQPNLCRFHE